MVVRKKTSLLTKPKLSATAIKPPTRDLSVAKGKKKQLKKFEIDHD